jgi:hypothetical protein
MEFRNRPKRNEKIPPKVKIASRGIKINKAPRKLEIHPEVLDISSFMFEDFEVWNKLSFLNNA